MPIHRRILISLIEITKDFITDLNAPHQEKFNLIIDLIFYNIQNIWLKCNGIGLRTEYPVRTVRTVQILSTEYGTYNGHTILSVRTGTNGTVPVQMVQVLVLYRYVRYE